MRQRLLAWTILLLATVACVSTIAAEVPHVMNYQGRLTDSSGDTVPDGGYIADFRIWNDSVGGSVLWQETDTVFTYGGLFGVMLGANVPMTPDLFESEVRYLGIQLHGDGEIYPRTPLVSVAYAFKAVSSDTAEYAKAGGSIGGAGNDGALARFTGDSVLGSSELYESSGHVFVGRTNSNATLSITPDYTGDKLLVTDYEALGKAGLSTNSEADLEIFSPSGFTDHTIRFGFHDDGDVFSETMIIRDDSSVGIGTSTPLEKLHVNGVVYSEFGGFRFPDGTVQTSAAATVSNWSISDSVLSTNSYWGLARGGVDNALYGDSAQTMVNLGVACTTGTSGENSLYSTVSGGLQNTAGASLTAIGGGDLNRANGPYGIIGGGSINTAGAYAFVGGGRGNEATGNHSTVAGGWDNAALAERSTVGGGRDNTAGALYGVVGGGYDNQAVSTYATVAGGTGNEASGQASTVGGGVSNRATGLDATVAGGGGNVAGEDYAPTIGGGVNNTSSGYVSTVCGGEENLASFFYATVGGGLKNASVEYGSTVGGGFGDTAAGAFATVAGGEFNVASGHRAAIGGGENNTVEGEFSTVPGGKENTIQSSADYSYLFGIGSTLSEDSTFMVDMPHVRFGDETDGYEFPDRDGDPNQVMATDGNGHLGWSDMTASAGTVPVGSVVAWMKSFPNTPSLPDNFVECNGQTLSDPQSPFDGQTIPDLNGVSGVQRFLRGSDVSGSTGGSENHQHPLYQTANAHGTGNEYSVKNELLTGNTPTLPSYYEVVWIMRVK